MSTAFNSNNSKNNKSKMTSSTEQIEEVTIKNVVERASAIWKNEKKTPLILNESGLMDRFFLHRDVNVIDAKSLFLKEKMQNIPHETVMEEMRSKLVNSMKFGKTLVIAMQNSAADIIGSYSGSSTFPVPEVFMPDRITDESVWSLFVKEQDMIYPNTNVKIFIVKPEFQVVVTSQFPVEDYQEFLDNALPLKQCKEVLLRE